jgi:WD40 repeat protein
MVLRGAQPSLIDQFDYYPSSDQVTTKIQETHKQEFQNVKTAGPPQIKPTGTLLSTFYEHTGPVNSIAVTDNQEFFMTGSRSDSKIHVWSVARNITDDATS